MARHRKIFPKIRLSVSSNGSTWVKHDDCFSDWLYFIRSFSILERIDVGETGYSGTPQQRYEPFSILERIDVGETYYGHLF